MTEFDFDLVGKWTEIKLKILREYGSAYTKVLKSKPYIKTHYIDGFSGAGQHYSKEKNSLIDGSPKIALEIEPKFSSFHFIDLDNNKTDYLREISKKYNNVKIYNSDANKVLLSTILPQIKYENYDRALCLLDPYGLTLDWQVVKLVGKSNAIDLFINFPVMDMNRNAIWRNPNHPRITKNQINRMTRFWGDESWKEISYQPSNQIDLFQTQAEKQSNSVIAENYRKRLINIANLSMLSNLYH